MAIVTIAHETGSGGPEIGLELAKRLGYRYVDREMLSEAALRYGVGEDKLTQVDETKPSLFERFDVETRQYITVLQSALLDTAEQDNVVINSRGGQVLLRGVAHALRVRVIAPLELRVKRVMRKMAGPMQESVDLRTTAEMVRRSDHEKHGRMRYLYDVDWGDPALYDLVLNTEKLSTEAAVEVIAGLVRGFTATEESRQDVRNRALASRVRSALAAHVETRKYRINVEADRGVIRLEGTAALDRAAEVARTVEGVTDVRTQLLEVPPIPPFVA
ncbi:MAG TPA: cytidylate kinase family protein [Methylomirabilota bacterium]|jgi:cytidylate kinase|nr:cytidylate kinase family protein [Methylomirabilota bacterium]